VFLAPEKYFGKELRGKGCAASRLRETVQAPDLRAPPFWLGERDLSQKHKTPNLQVCTLPRTHPGFARNSLPKKYSGA